MGLAAIWLPGEAFAQNTDTTARVALANAPVIRDSAYIADSIRRREIRKATRRSAIVPGWGQVTNKQVWKVPFVYAALGIPVYLFFDNLQEYRGLRQAYIYKTDTIPGNDDLIPDRYKPLSANSLRFYRDEFRRNVDYSALAFLIAWGLQVVDATVFANLRGFDVSDDLTLRPLPPAYIPTTGHTQVGVALTLREKPKHPKPIPAR